MKDVTGYPIEVGDQVMHSHGGRYHGFCAYFVIGFTPKMVRLSRTPGGKLSGNVAPENCAVVSGRPER